MTLLFDSLPAEEPRNVLGAGSISHPHALSTSQIDHTQISLGGGVKANTLCAGNDAKTHA